jgi:hypothetical protein
MLSDSGQHDSPDSLRRGDVVTVRSVAEILATLDADGRFDGMPFMPEMAKFCGMTFPITRRAEKTCVEGYGIRSLRNTVFLGGLRCNGDAHAGCQRGCLFFWKTAWLKTAGSTDARGPQSCEEQEDGHSCLSKTASVTHPKTDRNVCPPDLAVPLDADASAGEAKEFAAASQQSRRPYPPEPSPSSIQHVGQLPIVQDDRYFCQSTELARATADFPVGKLRCYLRDLRLGEITLRRFAYFLWRALSNRVWRLLKGRAYYELTGEQKKTLAVELNLQPGEWVEVKSVAEIQATLDAKGRNRGLGFDPEMMLHCGRRYRVATPLQKIIAEETGKMIELRNTVLLEGLTCQGICAMNCPRANYFYWREIWLKRV